MIFIFSMKLSKKQIQTFQNKIKNFYKKNKRDLPWRRSISSYRTVVSEIMLQQTQVPRVMTKFPEFIKAFPNFKQLANAPLRDVLKVWQGMGYNRRAKYLKAIAEIVTEKYHGRLPQTPNELQALPGIGPNTAASITAFAYNKPVVFIETNIRSVYIHEFSPNKTDVHDKDLMPIIEQTLDTKNPRDWYSALMDYGTKLKSENKNPNRKSKHYSKQSKFQGSDRQIRGMILKLLTEHEKFSEQAIIKKLDKDPERAKRILKGLVDDGMIRYEKRSYVIA